MDKELSAYLKKVEDKHLYVDSGLYIAMQNNRYKLAFLYQKNHLVFLILFRRMLLNEELYMTDHS